MIKKLESSHLRFMASGMVVTVTNITVIASISDLKTHGQKLIATDRNGDGKII